MKKHFTSGFSLVEVTLALGIAAFCLIALIGLMPVGIQTNRNATSQTRATNIMAAVIADLRATPKTNTTSSQFCIPIPTGNSSLPPLYFDSEGRCSSDLTGLTKPCGGSWVPALQTRYQLRIRFSQQSPTPTPPAVTTVYADVKVAWPAAAAPSNTNGSTEILAALDRN